jgi:hypothetical protein
LLAARNKRPVFDGGRRSKEGPPWHSLQAAEEFPHQRNPMIDILLVLLIIFMAITPVAPKGLEALIPSVP